jgi:dihydrodipicolinate synthase/N-acetylneuraminate lyase
MGLKDSSGNIDYLLEILQAVPDKFHVMVGSAYVFAPALLAGAKGGILAIANVLPEITSAIYQAAVEGDAEQAMKLQTELVPAVRLINGKYGVAGVKAAMDLRGLTGGQPRLPLLPCEDEAIKRIDALLDSLVEKKLIPEKKIG